MEPIIQVKHLKKSYGKTMAVRDLNFYVEKGKLFAFLGPNGAGKSTTINIICTFLKPDEGEVLVNGYKLQEQNDEIRHSIGTVFQESLLDGGLTVEENLKVRGSLYQLKKAALQKAVEEAAAAVNMENLLKRPYGKLSGGQRRRADIARALIHTPRILFLDEPTTGLDPQTRKNVWDTIRRIQREEGMTVFLTTHYMEEAEDADYCIIVDHGEISAQGTPYALKDQYAKDKITFKCSNVEKAAQYLTKEKIHYQRKEDVLTFTLSGTMKALPFLHGCREYLQDFTVMKGSMDDVFLNVTGKEIRE